ncbi:MAG TPA: DHA2 family efflux MFS transporter permease subunit [Ktedonobacteraceae bacterium]|nr:DHA2 family efflux MFS transporter permease subunit [Ktedonobacteraceae bacterium]
MQMSAAVPRRDGRLPYKWIVASVVIFGFFMTILDATIVNIAIPRLQNVFGADLTSVQWVLTAYTLVQGVATPLTAFLSQRLGQKRLYLIALGGFTVGSMLCGLSISLPMLIFFRVVQGAMGAFMSPLAITLLYSEFPVQERGTAMGALGIPILLAPALGPTLGGYIVTFLGWQLIFFINVPIGIIGIVLGFFFLRERRPPTRTAFDIPGFISAAVGLTSLLYALSDASTDGWGSTKVVGFLALGLLMLMAFIAIEINTANRGGQPLLDLRVFSSGPFTTSTIASILVTFALYGGLFILPIYLQNLRGLSAYQAGLLLLPQAFASMISSVLAGRLVDRLGVRPVIIPGLVILGIALWLFTRLGPDTPYETIQIWLIVRSLALGFCFQPLSVSALSEFGPRGLAQASSVSTTVRFVMSSFAVAVMATLVQTQTAVHYAHLAEMVTPSSQLGQLVPQLQALLMQTGASASAAYAAAIQAISGIIEERATILAMQDAFWLSLVLNCIAIVAAFFVRFRKPQTIPAQEQVVDRAIPETPETPGREEAMMAM